MTEDEIERTAQSIKEMALRVMRAAGEVTFSTETDGIPDCDTGFVNHQITHRLVTIREPVDPAPRQG